MPDCSQTALPGFGDRLGIPTDINVGYVPRSNETMRAMQHCCAPNKANIAKGDDCVIWCEIPDRLMEKVERGEIAAQLAMCFTQLNVSEPLIYGDHAANAVVVDDGGDAATNARAPTIMRLGLLVISVTSMLGLGV